MLVSVHTNSTRIQEIEAFTFNTSGEVTYSLDIFHIGSQLLTIKSSLISPVSLEVMKLSFLLTSGLGC